MSETEREIASQPGSWREAAERSPSVSGVLPQPGERAAAVGCGTSFFIAQAYAALREAGGAGETDAFAASEFPTARRYDRVVAISRSGTTTEVARLVDGLASPVTAIGAVAGTPVLAVADESIVLEWADERSVVQTRFATTALALLRSSLDEDLAAAIADGERAIVDRLPVDPSRFNHWVFLGHGWTVGLANEAALKMREAAQTHTESYPAMEYRHGPVSVAGPTSLVWILDSSDPAVADDVRAVGATVLTASLDPMAELILIQRTAVALAATKGLDPDKPRNLTRSVVLS